MEILPFKKDNNNTVLRNQELLAYIKELNYIPYRVNKKLKQRFLNLKKMDSVGDHSNMIYVDHLLIPSNKVNMYNRLIG
jgi:hypothetical protein